MVSPIGGLRKKKKQLPQHKVGKDISPPLLHILFILFLVYFYVSQMMFHFLI